MRILFLSHYFPPEVNAPASRTYEHCRQWVEEGHDVTVVTCFPNHPSGKIFPGYRNRLYQREEKAGITIVRLWTYITPNEGIFKRTLNYVLFMVMTILAAPFLRRTDVVITTSPQFFNGLAGYFVSRLKRAPWLLEIRDLWPDSILAVGAIKNARVIALLKRLELFAYRKADRIVVVTDAFLRHIRDLGIPAGKITVIKNGVDLSLFSPGPRDHAFAATHGLAGKFVASYVGTHGMAHGLESVLEAAAQLRSEDGIRFLLVGAGAAKQRLAEKRAAMGLDNVVMLDQLDRSLMPAVWSVSDACLVTLRKTPLFLTVIPSKIFEIMGMQKPIILGVEGESADIVGAAGAGLCVEPENASALADAVLKLFRDPDFSRQLGASGHAYVVANHDRRALARYYLEIVQQTAAGR